MQWRNEQLQLGLVSVNRLCKGVTQHMRDLMLF